MPLLIENREFSVHPYRLPDLLEDLELRHCTFNMCQHPLQRTASSRPTVRGVSLVRCHVAASNLGAVIAEDCTVDTIWFHRGIWGSHVIAGCAMRHVTIRGNVTGGLEFLTAQLVATDAERQALISANRHYYADVDWALDISEARFTSVSFVRADIPARLIRRDPETQIVITRRAMLAADLPRLLGNSAVGLGIDRFLETGFEDTVLVAAKRGRRFADEMRLINGLRAEGLVEED